MRQIAMRVAAGALLALPLGGCSGGPEPDLNIKCDNEIDSAWPQYTDFRQAWPDHRESCHAVLQKRPRTLIELNALKVAYGTDQDDEDLAALYATCAASGPDAWTFLKYAPRPSPARQEVRGALVLCPDHPDAALIKHLNG